MYYSSDREVEFQQELAADSQMRPSSLLRYRKQAAQYIQANRGPTIYFIIYDIGVGVGVEHCVSGHNLPQRLITYVSLYAYDIAAEAATLC